jgi:DNA-binding SARP family transcriptional activator
MPRLRVNLLGRTLVEVGGREVGLTPIAKAVLIRLVFAQGSAVFVNEIFHDVWAISGPVHREDRVSVQKRILELRRTLDPQYPGENSRVLRTERGRASAYRLVLGRDQVDFFQFEDLVGQARRATPAIAVELLIQALGLWRDRPLPDVADRPFAARTIQRLNALYHIARRELMHAYAEVGLLDKALQLGEALSADLPDDRELAGSVEALRAQLRARIGNQVFRHDFTDSGMAVAITAGDLFAQDSVNLVVGFTDTFDTTVDHDLINGTDSVQHQLVRRLYGGDRGQLDRDLRSALRHVAPEYVENRSAKRLGKLTRYPVGTVAALHHGERRIFAVASSRMSNDLAIHASLPDLLRGLAGLWDVVDLHGRLKPVALSLTDWGLARSYGVSDDGLLAIIIESFVARSRERFVCPELRVVIRPSSLQKVSTLNAARFVREELSDRRITEAPSYADASPGRGAASNPGRRITGRYAHTAPTPFN